MALKKVYFGSVGPFVYDDTVPVNDPDGDFAGKDHQSITTDGQMCVEQGPVADEEVIRLVDLGFRLLPPVSAVSIDNPSELSALTGDLGALVLAYEIIAATGQNEYTIYAYDASGPAVNAPYVMDAAGVGDERWIAIGGKYAAQHLRLNILTASRLITADVNKGLSSVANLSAWIAGTASQITITNDGDGTITISIPAPFRAPATGTNYFELLADGEWRLHGTARVKRRIRISAGSWSPGASAPTVGFAGVFPTLDFDAVSDDESHYIIIVPARWDDTVSVEFIVDWFYDGAPDAGTVCWALEYRSIESGDVVVGATTTITKVTAGNHTSGEMIRTLFTTKLLAVNLDRGAALGLRIYRDVSADTLATDARLIHTYLHFALNNFGEPT